MALLDLDKIIVKRTVIGIRCGACGGELKLTPNKSWVTRLTKVLSFGVLQAEHYQCAQCQKKYILL